VEDPRLRAVVISGVTVTADLQVARVGVRLAHGDTEQAREAALRGLRAAGARLRRAVAGAINLRRAPELRFRFDEGPDAQQRIEELLEEIHAEEKAEEE
jgi:ribosome-binding factor A